MSQAPDVSAVCELWILRGLPPEEIDLLLTARERGRRDGYLRPPDARRYVAGVALARLVFARFARVPAVGVRFRRVCGRCGADRHGKPHAVDLPVHHSVSHAGEVVAMAVTGVAPVGLDVEECLPLDDADGLLAAVRGRGEPPVTGLRRGPRAGPGRSRDGRPGGGRSARVGATAKKTPRPTAENHGRRSGSPPPAVGRGLSWRRVSREQNRRGGHGMPVPGRELA